MTDNDRIVCQVLEQQLSLRLREGCRDVLLHLLPAPLRGLLYIALRSSAAGYARLWGAPARRQAAILPVRSVRSVCRGRTWTDRRSRALFFVSAGQEGERVHILLRYGPEVLPGCSHTPEAHGRGARKCRYGSPGLVRC